MQGGVKLDIEQVIGKLKAYGGVRIAEKELREYVSAPDYNDYYNLIIRLVNSDVIVPVKSSGSNGMRPPLHKRYAIIKPAPKYDELIPEIRLLHEKFNIEGYLNEPERFKNHRNWVVTLDSFLKNNTKSLGIPFSVNERSFQVFGREKALREDRELAAVLSFNPGLREALNFYDTPEPFLAFTIGALNEELPDRRVGRSASFHCSPMRSGINILIIENKDTWYTLRNRMSPGLSRIAGISFHCLLYGEGRKISRKMDSLTDFDGSYFKGAKTSYYYFGDLDYEGIGIVHDLINVNPLLQIRLMLPLYAAMLNASQGVELPTAKENQRNKAGEWFLAFFDAEQRSRMKSILESGRYIPQEILNNGEFIKMVCSDTGDTVESHV